ncbi:MAG TPA: CBS domain-containing protein, partial [Thermoleophilaceae bacterium]|nr:CBS domain-containing protein [Thermoleophilaceae bacterium]
AGVEFRVAAAGPLVTLLVIAACVLAGIAVAGRDGFGRALAFGEGTGAVEAVLGYLAYINTLVLVFNLLPAFPLDGGRIARALVWQITGDRGKATRFAATLGRGFGFLMMAAGAALIVMSDALLFGISLIFIGLIIGQGARAAIAQQKVSARVEGVRVADVMDAQPVAIRSDASLEQAEEEFFLRYRWPWFPVVDPDGRLVGLVTHGEVEAVEEEQRPQTRVEAVMARDQAGTLRVRIEDSLDRLLASQTDGLQRLGAVMAVDGEGVLRGVVTLQQVERALRAAGPGT